MAREVAIKVSVNGTDQAVKTINELETAIGQMREELKGVQIGSEDFKKLSGEIQQAESKLKTLNKSFEGLEPQQKVEGFVKLGEGIAGAFAIGTAALTAFGVESEEVEKAQVAVQTAIAASIGARQLAEASLQAQIVATTISQKAYNLAASAGNAITKAFYTTLAANPITAIVVAVAALGAAIYGLVQAMDEQITAQDQINDALEEAEKNVVKQELALTSLKGIIDDTTKSEEQRQRALDELAEILPELNGLTLDQEDATLKVNDAYERNIKLIQQRAKAEVLSALIIEKTKELIEQQNSELDDNVGFWEAAWLRLRYSYNPVAAETAVVVAGVNNSLDKQQEIQNDINQFTEDYTEILDNLLGLEEEQEEILDDVNKQKERNNKAEQEAIRLAKEATKARQDAIKAELEIRKQVISIEKTTLPTASIISELKTELQTLNGVIAETLTEEEKLAQRIDEIFSIPSDKVDEFGELFTEFFPELSRQFLDGTGGFDEVADATLNQLAEKFVKGDITKEAFDAGVALLNNYKTLKAEVDKQPEFFSEAFNQEQFFVLVKDLKVASGAIITDVKRVNGEIQLSSVGTQTSLTEATENVGKFIQNAIDKYVELGLANEEEIEKSKELGETQEQFTKRLEEEAQTRVNNIIGLGDAIIGVEQQVKDVLLTSQDLLFQINQATGQARVAVFQAESDSIIQLAGIELKERQRGLGLLKSQIEDLAAFRLRTEQELLELIPEFEQLSADERLKIIDQYYEDLKKKREENAEAEQSSGEDFVEGLADGLRQISQVAQTGVQVFQEYVQVQLSLLQEQEARVLDQIVGDSEEAEQKRLEVQEEYEQKRKEISKQGQLAQLQLTRVQAVANVAEAITKALADGPIIGQILAGISAAIGLAQVGVITTQIGQVRSLARGGLLQGPSHEYGGIPLAGGGVVAEGNEAVINRRGSIDYRNLLNEVSLSSGGAPMVSSAFDDTRLIEAITKQNRDPIKAYVLEQEITQSQSVNKRLQQLSKI